MLKHVKMQVKALSFKKEAICENDLFSGAKFLSNGLRLLCSDESKFEIIFQKIRLVIRAQLKASLMVWGCISACESGNFHIWKCSINTEMHIQCRTGLFGVLSSNEKYLEDHKK